MRLLFLLGWLASAALSQQAPAARVSDGTTYGPILGGADPTVIIGGLPAARVGAGTVQCITGIGSIDSGSGTVFIGGLAAARTGDPVTCPDGPAAILSGAPTVLIGP